MAKRMTDTTIWKRQKWFRNLTPLYKLAWLYLVDSCDHAGVWKIDLVELLEDLGVEDFDLTEFLAACNQDYDKKTGKKIYRERLLPVAEDYLWLTGFLRFQYENKDQLLPQNKIVASALKILKGFGLYESALQKGFFALDQTNPLQTLPNPSKPFAYPLHTLPDSQNITEQATISSTDTVLTEIEPELPEIGENSTNQTLSKGKQTLSNPLETLSLPSQTHKDKDKDSIKSTTGIKERKGQGLGLAHAQEGEARGPEENLLPLKNQKTAEQPPPVAPPPPKNVEEPIEDAEKLILGMGDYLLRLCMGKGLTLEQGKECLLKYHLHLIEHGEYPRPRHRVLAGFQKWIRKEDKFLADATHQSTLAKDKHAVSSKSDYQTDKLQEWGIGNKTGLTGQNPARGQ